MNDFNPILTIAGLVIFAVIIWLIRQAFAMLGQACDQIEEGNNE